MTKFDFEDVKRRAQERWPGVAVVGEGDGREPSLIRIIFDVPGDGRRIRDAEPVASRAGGSPKWSSPYDFSNDMTYWNHALGNDPIEAVEKGIEEDYALAVKRLQEVNRWRRDPRRDPARDDMLRTKSGVLIIVRRVSDNGCVDMLNISGSGSVWGGDHDLDDWRSRPVIQEAEVIYIASKEG